MPSRPRRYVALLRGINLGARNRVPMARLRDVVEKQGAENVRTYIASGNVVLDSTLSGPALRRRLEQAIEEEFAISIIVVVLTAAELRAAIKRNPYPTAEPGTLHVAFAESDIPRAALDRLRSLDLPTEELTVIGRQIYYHVPQGFGVAQLPKEVDRTKIKTTVRNWRTVRALAEIAAKAHTIAS